MAASIALTAEKGVKRWQTKDYLELAFSFVPAAVFTWGIHELAHYLTGVGLGYEMWISFNQVGLVSGEYQVDWHQILVSAAGPMITFLQAAVALAIIYRTGQLWSYSLLFLTLWTRALAMGISMVAHPNDEARVSLLFGLPMWVLPGCSVLFLLTLTILGSRRLRVGWAGNGLCYLMASLVTAAIVFSDQYMFHR